MGKNGEQSRNENGQKMFCSLFVPEFCFDASKILSTVYTVNHFFSQSATALANLRVMPGSRYWSSGAGK